MIVVVVLGGLGLALLVIGRWGRRGAERLAFLPGLPERHLRRRTAVLRRGATACLLVGAAFVIMALGAAVAGR